MINMEKALLDVLHEEKELIKEIAVLEATVKDISDLRVHLLMNGPDCELKVTEIKRLQNEIDDKNNRKFDCKRRLEEARRSIASYFNYISR